MLRKRGSTPMPSGSIRMSSSRPPGRSVGLMQPTTPRQLVNDMELSQCFLVAARECGAAIGLTLIECSRLTHGGNRRRDGVRFGHRQRATFADADKGGWRRCGFDLFLCGMCLWQ